MLEVAYARDSRCEIALHSLNRDIHRRGSKGAGGAAAGDDAVDFVDFRRVWTWRAPVLTSRMFRALRPAGLLPSRWNRP